MNIGKCTQGEATVAANSVGGKAVVCVGILGSKKILAICGDAGAPDEEESTANAVRIASDWNRHNPAINSSNTSPCFGAWTLCLDLMPEEGVVVMITSPRFGLDYAKKDWEQGWNPEHWRTVGGDRFEMSDVVAWMPCPPNVVLPYGPEQDERRSELVGIAAGGGKRSRKEEVEFRLLQESYDQFRARRAAEHAEMPHAATT